VEEAYGTAAGWRKQKMPRPTDENR